MEDKYKLGMRNVKTGAAILVCLLICNLSGASTGFQSAAAAILCMQASVKNTVEAGIIRIWGTLIGAAAGVLLLILHEFLPEPYSVLMTAPGVMIVIYICNVIGIPEACSIAALNFLSVQLEEQGLPPVIDGMWITAETILGIVVAYTVNKYMKKPKIKRKV